MEGSIRSQESPVALLMIATSARIRTAQSTFLYLRIDLSSSGFALLFHRSNFFFPAIFVSFYTIFLYCFWHSFEHPQELEICFKLFRDM